MLHSLDCTKAIGPDNLPSAILKNCASSLAPSITAFFNCSFANGYFLSVWKYANLCPVHKKEKKADVTNYRPISLLSILSKVQEKCVLKRFLPHISTSLSHVQHGFREGLSCTTQLIEVFHEIGCALDKRLEIDLIYLDFSKAFDSVCHAKLLSKLNSLGITGSLLKWFTSYLSNRKQRVVINGSFSSWATVKSGVPQGSVLGPILFLLFVNDMPQVLGSSKLSMFADDSKCFKTIKSLADTITLQNDLTSLYSWSIANELRFQPSKCHNLRISRKKTSPERVYTLDGNELEIVTKERDLGVIVTKELKWNEHIKLIVSKANKTLGFLKRSCFVKTPKKTLTLLYTSLVRSYFCFASEVWAPQSTIKDLLLVEKTQRRASRFICRTANLSYKDRLIQLNLLPLNYWLEYLDLIFFFKCKHELIHLDLNNYVSYCTSNTRRGTTALHLNVQYSRTSLFRDSFFNRIVNLWNAIPENIKTETSVNSFKKSLKTFYFSRLYQVFDGDNICSYKLICPKCRQVNPLSNCSC